MVNQDTVVTPFVTLKKENVLVNRDGYLKFLKTILILIKKLLKMRKL